MDIFRDTDSWKDNASTSSDDDDSVSDPDYNVARDKDHGEEDDDDDDDDSAHPRKKPKPKPHPKPQAKPKTKTQSQQAKTQPEPEQTPAQSQAQETEKENENPGDNSVENQEPPRSRRARVADEINPLTIEEAKKISNDLAKQARTRMPGVRRKCDLGKKFTRWFAEMRKPPEIMQISDKKTVNINIKSFETDVEAAAAHSVLAEIFRRHVASMRAAQKQPYDFESRFKCHDFLIRRREEKGEPLPDCRTHKGIQVYVKACATDFKEIADAVKSNEAEMPADPHMQEAVRAYIEDSCPFYMEFPPDRIPPEKQKPSEKLKRKFNNPLIDGEDVMKTTRREREERAYIELDCSCDHYPQGRKIRWKVEPRCCLCRGLQHRLIFSPPSSE